MNFYALKPHLIELYKAKIVLNSLKEGRFKHAFQNMTDKIDPVI